MTQFDPNRDPRLQKYITSGGGTTQAVLTHESVDPDYIAIWLGARIVQASSGSYPNEGAVAVFTNMLAGLRTVYPHYVPRAMANTVGSVPDPSAGVETALIVWTQDDQDAAFADGWGVFQNDDHGTQIEHYIEGGIFTNDGEARLHVVHKSMHGSDLHHKAINYIRQERRKG